MTSHPDIRELSPGKTVGSVLSTHTSKRWGNANVFITADEDGRKYVVKDFSVCSFFVRYTTSWFLLWRETRAFLRLQDIEGMPGPPIIREKWSLKYPYFPGITLREATAAQHQIDTDFYEELEALVTAMHKKGVVHLDLRNRRNILVTTDSKPALIDFQTAIFTDHLPGFIRRFLFAVDLSGVYKHWHKVLPQTLTRDRQEVVNKMASLRHLWVVKGYPVRSLFRRLRGGRPSNKRNRQKIEIKDTDQPK
jgi:hypothetical protein